MNSVSEPRTLIQIVPRILPGQCGVSDHALALAEELRSSFKVETVFIALNQPYPVEGVQSCRVDEVESYCELWRERGADAVLAHVSGYGYAPTGIAANLALALRALQGSGKYRIAAFFHELYATGKPWQKAFWYSRRQRMAVQRIAEMCDMVLTNIELHARWLRSKPKLRCNDVLLCPVFSTIGEALEPLPFTKRLPVLVVFGLAGSRRRSYQQLQSMRQELQKLAVEYILDIGPDKFAPKDVHGISVHRLGILPVQKVREQISQARYGFVPHEPRCVAKSSIFAAYCAYGTIPVLSESFVSSFDLLQEGVHLISKDLIGNLEPEKLIECSRNAFAWYVKHNLHAQAELYNNWLRGTK